MASVLRICWNIIPLFFACVALTFTLLVMISGTSAHNQLSDIYFMRVCCNSVPEFRGVVLILLRLIRRILFLLRFLLRASSIRSHSHWVYTISMRTRYGDTVRETTRMAPSPDVLPRPRCTLSIPLKSSPKNSSPGKQSTSLNQLRMISVNFILPVTGCSPCTWSVSSSRSLPS